MTPSTSPDSVGDERLWQTNPVWCVDELLGRWQRSSGDWLHVSRLLPALLAWLAGRGVQLPPEAFRGWVSRGLLADGPQGGGPPTPGVVGIVVQRTQPIAWVAPLEARRAPTWAVADHLPFRPPTVLQDALIRLVGLPEAGALPERFAFALDDRLGYWADGPSMQVAGLLAVLGSANANPGLLRRTTAVVQPEKDRLISTRSVRLKLEAFVRECGRGTLLVRAAGDGEAAAFDCHFDDVWEVSDFADLSRHVSRTGLLRVFLTNARLSGAEYAVVRERLRVLMESHRYAEALELARRLAACELGPDVPSGAVREARRDLIDLNRHLGYQEESERLAVEEAGLARRCETSYDERARADVMHAAGLFDPHRFEKMETILSPWLERLEADALLVAPETRVMVFNTAARVRVILGRAGWCDLFRRSLAILRERDPLDMPRSWNYQAHGLLRCGRVEEASAVLAEADGHPAMTDFSRWMLRFLQAEHARQSGEVWQDGELENPGPRQVGHPFGFYFQATARQPGRERGDAAGRFRRAGELFRRDVPEKACTNILLFLADCMLLAEAVWLGEAERVRVALEAVRGHLAARPGSGLGVYYREEWAALEAEPGRETVEGLLRRVPFF